MNILMVSNTYPPHVGGVARSVESFTKALRSRGHRVIVVAPEFEGGKGDEEDIVRVPAIKDFKGSGFSVSLPIPGYLDMNLPKDFKPDLIHSHYPFLLGATALRLSASYSAPIVFTHHTMYEHYTHYASEDSQILKDYAKDFATKYANLCDRVIAPSQSVRAILENRGVDVPISCIPTGIDIDEFSKEESYDMRAKLRIPEDDFVIGHVGRLSEEKNISFLANAIAKTLDENEKAHLLLVGDGAKRSSFRQAIGDNSKRLHDLGILLDGDLTAAYGAMDVFAFASLTETQGMVLAEAMAAGVPVVALDAPGVREVVDHLKTGLLIEGRDEELFAASLKHMDKLDPESAKCYSRLAKEKAAEFSLSNTVEDLLSLYEELKDKSTKEGKEKDLWDQVTQAAEAEVQVWGAILKSFTTVITGRGEKEGSP